MYKQPTKNEKLNIRRLVYLSDLGQIYCNLHQYHTNIAKRNCMYVEEYMKKLSKYKDSKDLLFVPKHQRHLGSWTLCFNKKTIKQMEEMFILVRK